uniref:Uncharacterized protein n=1 Tax=Octopus bimaculoides TaxID=37653 RepID=A0A0L8HAW5_OCTBM
MLNVVYAVRCLASQVITSFVKVKMVLYTVTSLKFIFHFEQHKIKFSDHR